MSKLINVSDDVYKKLAVLKGKESYSFVIRNLLERRSNKEHVLRFFGENAVDENKVLEARNFLKKWSKKYA